MGVFLNVTSAVLSLYLVNFALNVLNNDLYFLYTLFVFVLRFPYTSVQVVVKSLLTVVGNINER